MEAALHRAVSPEPEGLAGQGGRFRGRKTSLGGGFERNLRGGGEEPAGSLAARR